MRVRRPTKPPTTWAFKESTPGGGLCASCTLDGDQNSCPRMRLTSIQQETQVATRCIFYNEDKKKLADSVSI